MNVNLEYCNPFDGYENNIWMKIEHCGRYLYACDRLSAIGCETVLDVACADGYGTKMLAGVCSHVMGVDINEAYLKQARARVSSEKVDFVQVDVDHNGFLMNDNSLDAVVCFETIEHVAFPEKLIQEIHRVLKLDGVLLLSFPNATYEKTDEFGNNKDPFHKHILQKIDVLTMLNEANFTVVVGPLGQSLCNVAYANLSRCQSNGVLVEQEINPLFLYDETSICRYARFLGYPDDYQVDDSYSFLFEAVKRR